PISGGHENVAGGRGHHRARASPDGRACAGAALRVHELQPGAAQRIPDVLQMARTRIEYGDVSLIGRSVADVPAGDGDHLAPKKGQWRRDLLAPRQPGDGRTPERATIGDGELLHVAMR